MVDITKSIIFQGPPGNAALDGNPGINGNGGPIGENGKPGPNGKNGSCIAVLVNKSSIRF